MVGGRNNKRRGANPAFNKSDTAINLILFCPIVAAVVGFEPTNGSVKGYCVNRFTKPLQIIIAVKTGNVHICVLSASNTKTNNLPSESTERNTGHAGREIRHKITRCNDHTKTTAANVRQKYKNVPK